MEQDIKKPIEGEIIGDSTIIPLGDIPKIDSLVHYNVGDIKFDDIQILEFIDFIKQIYSQDNLNKRSEEVNRLLDSNNVELVYEKLKLAKKNPAELNNLAKDLDGELKKIKKIWNAPFSKFETAIKKAVVEIKTIASYLKEVEIDPLSDTCRDHKFNTFTVPILETVRSEIQALYEQVDCKEYVFSQDPKYYNLGSKKADIYLIAKMELELWARGENEKLLKVQEQGRKNQLIHQEFQMWEKIYLPEYNKKNDTNWTVSEISQEINATVPKVEIYKLLDFKTQNLKKESKSIEKTDFSAIEDLQDSIIIGSYDITFPNISSKNQFENWLSSRNGIKWNR